MQTFQGTLAGTVSGSQASLTLTFPAGAFTAAGTATCSVTGSGTSSTATTSSLMLTVNLTFAQACNGTQVSSGNGSTETDQITLTK
jgi:hypothetical protein